MFDLEFPYSPGNSNTIADALFRLQESGESKNEPLLYACEIQSLHLDKEEKKEKKEFFNYSCRDN